MKNISLFIRKKIFILIFILSLFTSAGYSQEIIDFESGQWELQRGSKITDHLGQKSLAGDADLKDVEFDNGIIEFDISFTGGRCFAGLNFRIQSPDNMEHFYLRPHKTNLPDALQYTPVFKTMSSWQLYSGEGFTAAVNIPYDKWIHVKLEVSGTQARIFLDNSEKPAIEIHNLKHGNKKGSIGLFGPANGLAHFANFKYKSDNSLVFKAPPKSYMPIGTITDWQLSQKFMFSSIEIDKYTDDQKLPPLKWRKIKCDPTGLVDIARYETKIAPEANVVIAKTVINSDKDKIMNLTFGYSDVVSIFLNGKVLYFGNSVYRQRDPGFLGILGMNDAVYLPLKKGKNELMLMVAEVFGGWGFMCRDGEAEFVDKSLTKVWETEKVFKFPETVIYDRKRDILYVSNYDQLRVKGFKKQSISKVSLDGKIVELDWITGLNQPLGMTLKDDKLFVAERRNVVEIDIESSKVVNNYPIPQSLFINDIVIERNGNFYLSDSRKNMIFRYSDGKFEEWLKGKDVEDPNTLYIQDNKLLFGNSGDHCFKSVDLTTKEVKIIANIGPGFIDGIRIESNGDYLVSHWDGRLFRITPEGKITKLLDTATQPVKCADFEYIEDKNLLIIPTMNNGIVKAYKLNK